MGNLHNSIVCISLCLAVPCMAQSAEPDSIKTRNLEEVVVEAQSQSVSATVSTYIPTKRQKNSAQTGSELLNRMGIPQLGLVSGNSVTTSSGQNVDLFIDYVPATEQELSGMRMSDVKKVEYYDFPQDPRFQGKAHVINFIMQKYEYGGYVKAYVNEFFIANSGQLNLYSKFQYKRMTYDVAVGGWHTNNGHTCNATEETYRLPQPDGSLEVFKRSATPTDSRVRQHSLWPTLKAKYQTDKIMMVNTVGANFHSTPKQYAAGTVSFNPEVWPQTGYVSNQDSRTNSITYSGYWNFILPRGNSISFNPYYSYSYTKQHSLYTETGGQTFDNGATDKSQHLSVPLRYVHDFGKWGNITAICNTIFKTNSTRYTDASNTYNHLTSLRIGPGLFYNYQTEKFNGLIGGGFNYYHSKFGNITEHSMQPWMDISIQYAFDSRNSINAEFHHATWPAASSDRSSAVIQTNPLFSYTGNPELNPYKSYDVSLRYVWMPDNKWSISVFGDGNFISDRFVYAYRPSADGILRTISQDAGNYAQWLYGVTVSARLLDNSLMLNGQIAHRIVRNGSPYGWTKQAVPWYLQAFYYLKGWTFGLQYQSTQEYCDGYVSGIWMKAPNAYTAIVGWGNSTWNIKTQITNPFRWNWKNSISKLETPYYDVSTTSYDTVYHCYILVSATYTFGYGKKIQRGNEASQQMGTSSSILR